MWYLRTASSVFTSGSAAPKVVELPAPGGAYLPALWCESKLACQSFPAYLRPVAQAVRPGNAPMRGRWAGGGEDELW